MEWKNRSIDLFGVKYQIKFVDDIVSEDDSFFWGMTYHDTHTIKVATKVNGKPLPDKDVKITLAHEIMHAILATGAFHNENNNESLVEWVAKCIVNNYSKFV